MQSIFPSSLVDLLQVDKLDGVTNRDFPLVDRGGVEAEHTVETPHYIAQYAGILLERVGVEGGHDAPRAKALHHDHELADADTLALPIRLLPTFRATDDDVRPEPPDI